MTEAEALAVDLPGRMAFADAVDASALPIVRSDPGFGGAYFEPANGGRLIILLTRRDAALETALAARMPKNGPGWRVVVVNHSETELLHALASASEAWRTLGTSVQPLGFGLAAQTNGLFVEVLSTDVADGQVASSTLARMLGVPVEVRTGTPGHDTVCTSRDNCGNPMKAGINIYKGANFSGGWCTMGFHISIGTDEQFVTAGHCGFTGSDSWFHPAFSSAIGSELGTLYANGGQDIMRVSMLDIQASDDVYNDGNDIIGMGTPVAGETLCASLGKGSNTVRCGTVQSAWRSWTSETAGYTVWGGDMSYTTVGGDSGSPVYRRIPGGTGDQLRAIGTNDHEMGYFARLDMSLGSFGAVVFQ